ncbi:isoprenylcysteine carboxylmethyltransferase family protein [Pseudoalteromonas sp. MMG010]|nr:isoprenylcysteine carboxylmethyltransferase family protein [Pseudoalteromonas sp. MMG010]
MPVGEVVEFTRVYLAAFYTFVAVFYTFRIVSKNRVISGGVVFEGEKYCQNWWNHLTFRFFRVVIWLICVARLFYPELDQYLGHLTIGNNVTLLALGSVLLTIGFALSMWVHFNMATLWRSGIDPQGPAQLKTNGLYRYSRNPMFIGVAIAQWGFFLAMPSVFTLVCLVIGFAALRSQISTEEAHLLQRFQSTYLRYLQSVPRWL